MKANRRTTALKSKAESKVAGSSKVRRIAQRHEELHREQLRRDRKHAGKKKLPKSDMDLVEVGTQLATRKKELMAEMKAAA